MSQAQEVLKALSKILKKDDKRTSKLADSIVAVLEIERKEEQNRIIESVKASEQLTEGERDYFIALIKGEQK